MKVSSSSSRGSVRVNLVAAPAGGWDIGSVTVNGREVTPTRKGEFESESDAEAAAYQRAEAFAKEQGLDVRY